MLGDEDRIRSAQEFQRVIEYPTRVVGLVHAHGAVVRHVDAVHREQLAAVVGRERGRRHHGNRQLNAGYFRYGFGHCLGEEAALAGRHLERRATRHGVDDLRECTEHRAVHEIDRAHERHAGREGDHGQHEPADVAADEPQRDTEAPERHRPPPRRRLTRRPADESFTVVSAEPRTGRTSLD